MTHPPLKAGDVLWFVADSHRHGERTVGYAVTVAKIGKRWATLDKPMHRPERIDMETWEMDGGQYTSPGRCYASREAYEAHMALKAAWENFAKRLSAWNPPDGVDLEWIEAAHERLGIPK